MSVNVAYENAPLFPAEVTQLKDKYLVVAKDLNDGKVHVGLIPEINSLGELKDQSEGALSLKNIRAYVSITSEKPSGQFQNARLSSGMDNQKMQEAFKIIKESMGEEAYNDPKAFIKNIASSALLQTMQVNMLMRREFITPILERKDLFSQKAMNDGVQTQDEQLKKDIAFMAKNFRIRNFSPDSTDLIQNENIIKNVQDKFGINRDDAENKIKAILFDVRKNLADVSVTYPGNQGIGITNNSKDDVSTAFKVESEDIKGNKYSLNIMRAQLEVTKINVDGSFEANLSYGINTNTSSKLPFGVKALGAIPVKSTTDDILNGILSLQEGVQIDNATNEGKLWGKIVAEYSERFKTTFDIAVNQMLESLKLVEVTPEEIEKLGSKKYKEARLEAMDAEDAGKEYNLLPKEEYMVQAKEELNANVRSKVDNLYPVFKDNIGINSYHQISTVIAQAIMNTRDLRGANNGNVSLSYLLNNTMKAELSDGVSSKEFSELFKEKINQAYANISALYGVEFKAPEHGIKAETVEVKAPVSSKPQAKNDLEIN